MFVYFLQKMEHPDIDLFLIGLEVIFNMTNVMFYCYMGSMTTMCFEQLAAVAYQSRWFEYDIEIRHSLLILIEDFQHPIILRG